MELSMLKMEIEELIREKTAHPHLVQERKALIEKVIELLDEGQIRVAEWQGSQWVTHAWVKSAILMYFQITKMHKMESGPFTYFDKIPLKENYQDLGVRVVPPATARYGSYMERGVVLMPSYVNIGAYIGADSMVDTWATVGSCAQIGSHVHLSGGVGIGGVLEPATATPVIVEDGAFLGSRSIVVEGVRIGKEAVLAANTTLTASTPIIDTRQEPMQVLKGYVPERCVVVPGVREKKINGQTIHLSCAYIIGERKVSTDLRTSLNSVLREFSISV